LKYQKKCLYIIICIVMSITVSLHAQQTETIFGSGTDISFLWGIDNRSAEIQNDFGSMVGFYGGALINKSLLIAFSTGLNLAHPDVNQGYLGLLCQYTKEPQKLKHYSAQLFVGRGSTKDYMMPKTNAFDNFGNVTGPSFLVIEPGINIEFNLHEEYRAVVGLAYRHVSGLDESDVLINKTNVTNEDLSGVNLYLSLKIGKY